MAEETLTVKKSTLQWLVVAVVVLVIGFGIGRFTAPTGNAVQNQAQAQQPAIQPSQPSQPSAPSQPTQPSAPTQPSKVSLTIPSYAPYQGQASAGLNIVEFADYQCPFCERYYSQTEPQVTADYVTTGKAKYYFLDFAFLGPDSTTLGDGAWCANDQGKYWEYHDYVYQHQGQENSGWATADNVKQMAGNITGLDVAKFSTCLDAKTYESRVGTLTQLGQGVGVTGTPSFLIGSDAKGYTLVVGAQPYATIKAAIDQQLSAA